MRGYRILFSTLALTVVALTSTAEGQSTPPPGGNADDSLGDPPPPLEPAPAPPVAKPPSPTPVTPAGAPIKAPPPLQRARPAFTVPGHEPTPPPAPPEPEPRFGDSGVGVLSGGFSLSAVSYSATSSGNSGFSLSPGFDYFVARNFSLGGSVLASSIKDTSTSNGREITATGFSYGAAASVGFNAWLAPTTSFWPKLSLGFRRGGFDYTAPASSGGLDGVPYAHTAETSIPFVVSVPLLFHITKHVYIGLGLTVQVELVHDIDTKYIDEATSHSAPNKRTSYGLSSSIGAWL